MKRSTTIAALLISLLLGDALGYQGPVRAEGTQPYAVREFTVSKSPDLVEQRPVISGSLVVWGEAAKAPRKMHGRRLPDGEPFTFGSLQPYITYDLDGERLVTVEVSDKGYGVYLYQMTDFARREIAPPNGADLGRAGRADCWGRRRLAGGVAKNRPLGCVCLRPTYRPHLARLHGSCATR